MTETAEKIRMLVRSEGLSQKEIARKLDLTIGQVKSISYENDVNFHRERRRFYYPKLKRKISGLRRFHQDKIICERLNITPQFIIKLAGRRKDESNT